MNKRTRFRYKILTIGLLVLIFGLISARGNFVIAKASTAKDYSIEAENIDIKNSSTAINVFGDTHTNNISVSGCNIDRLVFNKVSMNIKEGRAVKISKDSNIVAGCVGKSEIQCEYSLTLSSSKMHFDDSSMIIFRGNTYFDAYSKLSFSPNSNVVFTSGKGGMKFTARSIDCGEGKSGFLHVRIKNRDEARSDIGVNIISKDKSVNRSFTLNPGESEFAVSLPKNEYNITYNIDEGYVESQYANLGNKMCSVSADMTELRRLKIVDLKLTSPTKFEAEDGKIQFSAVGGSGKCEYYCGTKYSYIGEFGNLRWGIYEIGAKDKNGEKVSKTIKIENPFSTEISKVVFDGKSLSKGTDGDFELMLSKLAENISFDIHTRDNRAQASVNEGKQIVIDKYGVTKIPVKVTAGDTYENTNIVVKVKPEPPIINNLPSEWITSEYVFNLPQKKGMESYISVDAGKYSKASSAKVDGTGRHRVECFYEIDGVQSDTAVYNIKIDKEKPKIDSVFVRQVPRENVDTINFPSRFVCTVMSSDEHSGIGSVSAKLDNGQVISAININEAYLLELKPGYSGSVAIVAKDRCGTESDEYILENVDCDINPPEIILARFPKNEDSQPSIEILFDEEILAGVGNIYYSINKGVGNVIDENDIIIENNKININLPVQGGKYKLFIPKTSIKDVFGNCLSDDVLYLFKVEAELREKGRGKNVLPSNTLSDDEDYNQNVAKLTGTTAEKVFGIGAFPAVTLKDEDNLDENGLDEDDVDKDDLDKDDLDKDDLDKEFSQDELSVENMPKIINLIPKGELFISANPAKLIVAQTLYSISFLSYI